MQAHKSLFNELIDDTQKRIGGSPNSPSLSFRIRYTALQRVTSRDAPCEIDSLSTLPDLTIVDVASLTGWMPYNSVEEIPLRTTLFRITIRNVGLASFDGSILIRYSDKRNAITAGNFPLHGRVQALMLHPQDSTQLEISQVGQSFQAGTLLEFLLATDSYPPHSFDPMYYFPREPVCELSYVNNIAEYLMP